MESNKIDSIDRNAKKVLIFSMIVLIFSIAVLCFPAKERPKVTTPALCSDSTSVIVGGICESGEYIRVFLKPTELGIYVHTFPYSPVEFVSNGYVLAFKVEPFTRYCYPFAEMSNDEYKLIVSGQKVILEQADSVKIFELLKE